MAELTGRDPLRATLNPALRSFWRTPARIRVLYGGRASTKSWDAAGFAVFLAANYKVRVLCTRQFQNKIEESVYTLLKVQIERFGLRDQFEITNNKIVHRTTGSEFLFYGLWRHIDEIKSLEGIDICWVEEAHNLTKAQFEILEPTLRKDDSQFWIIFNPRLATDFVYRKFVTETPDTVVDGAVKGVRGDTIKRLINYPENPYLSNTMRRVIEKSAREEPDEHRHIYLGEPRDDDERAVIKRSWVLAAIGAKQALIKEKRLSLIQARGRRVIGFDIGDTGDPCATVERHGIEVVGLDEWKARVDELPKSVARVHAQARMADAEVVYDSIGVGAFAGGYFNDLNELTEADVKHRKFNAGGDVIDPDEPTDPNNPLSPTNGDHYSNLKAQTWWEVASMFRHTFNVIRNGAAPDPALLISINPTLPELGKLIDELCTPREDYDLKGKSKVESKKDLKKRQVPSHNKADAFIQAFARDEVEPQAAMLLTSRRR